MEPRPNWDLIGHEWAVDMLRPDAARPRHAYLFTGPRGVGRRTLAMRFAQAIACEQRSGSGDPCGLCDSCKRMQAERHPDVIVVQALTDLDPPGPAKEGGVLRVEQIRELRNLMHLQPAAAPYRFALLLRFHEANDSAANALLKTLEEAPPHAILMLTADAPEQLLATIVSRCEVLRLRPGSVANLSAAFEQRGFGRDEASLAAHLAGGRAGLALRVLRDGTILKGRAQRLEELRRLLNAPRVERFAFADRSSKNKEALRETFITWLSYWRDVFLRANGSIAPMANPDRAADIETMATRLGPVRARSLVRRTEESIDLLARSANARLVTEVLLLDYPHA